MCVRGWFMHMRKCAMNNGNNKVRGREQVIVFHSAFIRARGSHIIVIYTSHTTHLSKVFLVILFSPKPCVSNVNGWCAIHVETPLKLALFRGKTSCTL